MAVNQTFRELTDVQPANTELSVHHSFSPQQTQQNESKVVKMMKYIISHENPFNVTKETELKLHNVFTRAILSDETPKSLLSVKGKRSGFIPELQE